MSKYMLGNDGYYEGAVLKEGEKGIVQCVVFKPGGDWIVYGVDRKLNAFPLWNRFPDKKKRSLGQLTEKEFRNLVKEIDFLPDDELRECYTLLKGGSQNAEPRF